MSPLLSRSRKIDLTRSGQALLPLEYLKRWYWLSFSNSTRFFSTIVHLASASVKSHSNVQTPLRRTLVYAPFMSSFMSSYSSSHQPERTHLFEHAADVAYRGVLACNCKCGLQPPRWYSVLFFRIRKMAVLDCSSKIFYQSEKDENIYIKKFILRCDKKKNSSVL